MTNKMPNGIDCAIQNILLTEDVKLTIEACLSRSLTRSVPQTDNEKRLLLAKDWLHEQPLATVFDQFMADKDEYSKMEWTKRFEGGTEWCHADYTNRWLLQKLAPDFYPKDDKEFFRHEGVKV